MDADEREAYELRQRSIGGWELLEQPLSSIETYREEPIAIYEFITERTIKSTAKGTANCYVLVRLMDIADSPLFIDPLVAWISIVHKLLQQLTLRVVLN